MLHLCEEIGLQKPSCYQGEYNLVTRGMETKLLPILRAHGMSFNAFRFLSICLISNKSIVNSLGRPLASGFLTGKLINNDHADTRFGDNNPLGKMAQKLYGAADLHSVMKTFDTEVKTHDMTPIEVAIRWIVHHSALRDEDGIILGASKIDQLRGLMTMIRMGPLPEEVVKIAEDLWGAIKGSRGEII